MMLPACVFLLVNVVLWKFVGAVFMPELLASRFFEFVPSPEETVGMLLEHLIFINFVLLYFGAYFLFAFCWKRLRRTFRNPFYGVLVLLCVNLFVLFPLAGRGVFGYQLPQGPLSASSFILASHWILARVMQTQERREKRAMESVGS
jgi:hypothetical protein